ncbi:Adventurous gliding motility protein S [Chitinispirillum alkaliphilum]|nr:Adventurous gliding motility protein S [Chitinispirillum alkaliphilum]
MSFPASKGRQKQLRKPRSNTQLKGFKPQMTSLIDVMTILLIYLLKSFSAQGEIITISQDLLLPESSAEKFPELMVTIVVNNRYIMAENTVLAEVDEVLESDDLVIPQLYEWLRRRREATERISILSDDTEFKGEVMIQGDKRIRFALLKKIMYTCGQQQFNQFSLAVRQREG